VHAVVCRQTRNELEHLGLGGRRGEPVVEGADADLLGGFVLSRDVEVRWGVVADQDGREPDRRQRGDLLRDLRADARRERGTVHPGSGQTRAREAGRR
jgi:hypothetical protein